MAGLALIAWYCTVSKEVNATINSYFVTLSIPMDEETRIVKRDQGRWWMAMLSSRPLH